MSLSRSRNLRASLLPGLTRVTCAAPTPVLLAARPVLAWSLAHVRGWKGRVRAGMQAALGPGGFEERHVRDYFSHLADLVAYSAAVYRSGIHGARLEREWVHDPASRDRYRAALAEGKGALMVCPHLIGHEVMAGSATVEFPLTVLVRKSPEPAYEALKQRWYAAMGAEVVYRPQKGSPHEGLAEITSALRVLRKNRVLALTPDLLRKPGTGIRVRLFNRDADLPAGAFFLAARTGAPLMPTFFHKEAGLYRLWTHEPLRADPGVEQERAVAALAQRWTTLFEAFVREHPDMWQFWLDKRWSRWLGVGPSIAN
jgi:lauroyl/myristoyl acyltransferase